MPPKRKHKWGYCRNCIKNVPHVRHVNSKLFRVIDAASFRAMAAFRVGPWYCEQCERKVFILKRPQFDAADFRTAESYFEDERSETPVDGVESAGNFLRTDESLVVRSTRLRRFSEKYRDALVRRILEGTTTISNLRQDKNLSEAEVISWISDKFNRMEKQLHLLEEHFAPSLGIEYDPDQKEDFSKSLDSTQFDPTSEGTIVEGQVRPK
ncbi:MAG: hypothetical protein AB8B55_02490 [Mariniblastus sp.]